MHLNFKKDDIITVYCKHGLRLNSFKFQVVKIEQTVNGHKIIGARFTVDNKKEEGYELFLYYSGKAWCYASYIGNPMECYLDKQSAISKVEKQLEKEFKRINQRKSELLKFKFLEK